MKILKTVATETLHTIELTNKELATLTVALGKTNDSTRQQLAGLYGKEILSGNEAQMLYSYLSNKVLDN